MIKGRKNSNSQTCEKVEKVNEIRGEERRKGGREREETNTNTRTNTSTYFINASIISGGPSMTHGNTIGTLLKTLVLSSPKKV